MTTRRTTVNEMKRRIRVARGDEAPDLVIAGGHVVNTFTGETERADVAVAGGVIVGVGQYGDGEAGADSVFDAAGRFVVPGFIDAHIHIESTCLTPSEFARAVVPSGTTAVIADPHEIANVLGVGGIRYMIESARGLPLDVRFMLPSCVPSTSLETAGARLEAGDLAMLLDDPRILGLAEVMNFPGVIAGDTDLLAKIRLCRELPVDGHAPGVTGRDLCAYVSAGISSDHESTTLDEAMEKLARGMFVMLREGSVARNMEALMPAVTPETLSRCALVTDDLFPVDLAASGHVDGLLRRAVELGLPPATAIRLVTLNPATWFGLDGLGAVAPGYRANVVVLDDLTDFRADAVFRDGRLVAREGKLVAELPAAPLAPSSRLRIAGGAESLELFIDCGQESSMRVIDVVPDQLLTRSSVLPARVVGGSAVADPARDIAKIAVVERHRATGNVGLAFVRGLGLREGAIASTVAHDSHNVVVAGIDDHDMRVAVRALEREGGGMVAVRDGRVEAMTPLPVAGLMSPRPFADVARAAGETLDAARRLGSSIANPFMTLSFLALPVIPELKLTDRGLVDVTTARFVEAIVDGAPDGASHPAASAG